MNAVYQRTQPNYKTPQIDYRKPVAATCYTSPMDEATRDALLTLSLTPGLGPTLTRRCIEAFGSPESVVDTKAHRMASVDGIGSQTAQKIRRNLDHVLQSNQLADEIALVEQYGVTLLSPDCEEYPALLRHIPDPPPLLYVRGELRRTDAVAIAVVGARKCTAYGREQADRLSAMCSQAGLTIVSGGAYGIDAAAHRAAMRVQGRTIAVLGSGIAKPYPEQHTELFDDIAASHGAVMSELPMTAPPMRENFPRRNRIVSGLALGVLVIEASTRSGALITARLCSEDHNREVMAVPGRVDSLASAGCHRIIREGWAALVTNGADILDALGETGELLKAGVAHDPHQDNHETSNSTSESLFEQTLSDSQSKILAALTEPRMLDQVAAATSLPVHVIQSDLTMLQIRGMVQKEGVRFVRKKNR